MMRHNITHILSLPFLSIAFAGSVSALDPEAVMSSIPPGMLPVAAVGLLLILLFAYSYKLQKDNLRLKEEAARYKSKLAEYVSMHEEHIEPAKKIPEKSEIAAVSSQKVAEDSKATMREQYTKRLYWDRLESTIRKSAASDLTVLDAKKRDIDDIIQITKRKRVSGEIDENSYGEIMTQKQKELIELEARISKLKKSGDSKE
ncbi:MAG: hypothetical protein PHG85_00245 [Candidatus Altiarchaeota archaeon]|nr:hypothetical protein [Candidatus Altiarchaeota archaeon]